MIPPTEPWVLSREALGLAAAGWIVAALSARLRATGRACLVPSAGRTPIATYAALRARYRDAIDWRCVHLVQMDEYKGLAPDDPRSLAGYLRCQLVEPLGIGTFTHFNGADGRLLLSPAAYERRLPPIDLVVHGIGRNGHIGFNEPGAAFTAPTREVRLSASTLRANFATDVDRQACATGLTLGLGCLLAARQSLLLAWGVEKAGALRRALCAAPSPRCPASGLRLTGRLTVMADPEAARRCLPAGATSDVRDAHRRAAIPGPSPSYSGKERVFDL